MQKKGFWQDVVVWLGTFAVVVLTVLTMSAWKERREALQAFDAYASGSQPHAKLIADFSNCLKRRTPFLPFRSMECGGEMNSMYGPAAMHNIDAVAKSLNINRQ